MTFPHFHSGRMAAAALMAGLLAACASVPLNNPALNDARAAYEQAAANAQIARSAPLDLQRAQDALRQADTAMRAGEDAAAIEHYAYLARQRTEAAVQAGKIAQAEQDVTQARVQRDRILIEARAREADEQRAAAEKARAQAEAARKSAEEQQAAAEAARKMAQEQQAAAEAARQKAIAEGERAAKLSAQLEEMKARKTERGMVLTLGDVLFDTGMADLKPGAFRTIDQLAEFMKENPERNVQIEGHTDATGPDEFNQVLSERRADAVRLALIDRGIDMRRISARGFGKSNPVASNDTAAGRQQNRRVEVIISETN